MSADNRNINDLIAGELSAIRQAVEARGPVDIDALARRVNELARMDSTAAAAASSRQAGGRGVVERGDIEDGAQRRGLIYAPGQQVADEIVRGGKFDGLQLDDVVFVRNFLRVASAINPSTVRPPSQELEKAAQQRALSATGTGAGDEYVPTGMAGKLWLDAFLASKVVASMQRVAMPTDPFDMPLGWGALTWRKGVRNSATTPQDPATAKGTLTATEQVVEVDWDYTLDEDAVIAVLPTLRVELARSAGEQMDAFALNADSVTTASTNINAIDGTPASDAYYMTEGQKGIRYQHLVDNTAQTYNMNNAALTDAGILGMLALMGKYAADPERMIMIADAKTYINGLMAVANVRTRDKFGVGATILTGQLAAYGGVPIVVSESMGLSQSTGKQSVTASNNTLGNLSVLHRDLWRVGFRREILVEIDRDVKKRQFVMVVSFRIAVAARGTRSTNTHTAGMRYIVV